MSKVLDVNELLDVAEATLTEKQYAKHRDRLEAAVQKLGDAVAKKLRIDCFDVSHQPGMGGLCASFKPDYSGQPMPEALEGVDEGGDWDD